MARLRTHYDNLKVAPDAPLEVIRAAYKTLSQKYHPDRNPGDKEAERVMMLINVAFDILSDPEKRAKHDEWIESAALGEEVTSMDSDTLLKTLAEDFSARVSTLKEMGTPVVVGASAVWVVSLVVLGRLGVLGAILADLQQLLYGFIFSLASGVESGKPAKIAELSVPLSVFLVFIGVGVASVNVAFWIGVRFVKRRWGVDLYAIGPAERIELHQAMLST